MAGPVHDFALRFVIDQLYRIMPQLTGGRFRVDTIETGRPRSARERLDSHFVRSGNGRTPAQPEVDQAEDAAWAEHV